MVSDNINVIEDEPYEGYYNRGKSGSVVARAGDDNARLELARAGDDNARLELADMLRERREAMGLSLDEVETLTRVRRKYLEAFEQAAYDVLPSRAFSIGYIKAYARALDMDEDTLADLFKQEIGGPATRLQAPTGASMLTVRSNYKPITIGIACLVMAIVGWNVMQRKPMGEHHAEQATLNEMAIPEREGGTLILTSRKKAAPKDQDIPQLYYTAGLEEGFAAIDAERNGGNVRADEALPLQQRKAFNPRGAIYGAPPEQSVVTLQARKSVELIVRNPDGTIQFAQYLGAGEAFRIPQEAPAGLVITVSDPTAFEVYFDGELAGGLDVAQMPAQRLNARALAMSDALDRGATLPPAGEEGAATPAPSTQPVVLQPGLPQGPIPYTASRPAQTEPAAPAVQGNSDQ